MGPQQTWLPGARCQERAPPKSDQDKEKRWAEMFDLMDLNKDGHIDVLELRAGLAGRGLSRASVDRVSCPDQMLIPLDFLSTAGFALNSGPG